MKHIHTFENFLDEDNETGVTAKASSVIGPRQERIVISGDAVESKQDDILKAIAKIDKDNKVQFYPITKKIVGAFTTVKMSDLKRELKRINDKLTVEVKNPIK